MTTKVYQAPYSELKSTHSPKNANSIILQESISILGEVNSSDGLGGNTRIHSNNMFTIIKKLAIVNKIKISDK